MKVKNKRLIVSEVVLILASVLVFRGLWHLLDKIPLMNNEISLTISLILGVVAYSITLHYMITHKILGQ
jgi:hypothetical protein